LDTGHNHLVASTEGIQLEVWPSLQSVLRDILLLMLHGVRVHNSFSFRQDVIGSRQSNTAAETLLKTVILTQFGRASNGDLAGTKPELDTMNIQNDLYKPKEEEERKLHRMAKVDILLEVWHGIQNHRATQTGSGTQFKPMTTLDTIWKWKS
jgi:hypothetical protein